MLFETTRLWIAFTLSIVLLLSLDLFVLHRQAHSIRLREAAAWSFAWFGLAMLFASGLFVYQGHVDGLKFLTGYVIEISLSVDNVFLFAVLFAYFEVPLQYQHRVLSWGVLSAVLMRGIMIAGGGALLDRFEWLTYVFGIFLVLTGVKMFLSRNKQHDPGKNFLIRTLQRTLPLTDAYDGQKFFTQIDGKHYATPLLLVLVMIEITDLLFALDSIPAIFAITDQEFLVFTSNIFAILGLRSLYFLLAGVMDMFCYLAVGLAVVLVFVGFKMLGVLHLPTIIALPIIVGIIGIAIAASLLKTRRDRKQKLPGTEHTRL